MPEPNKSIDAFFLLDKPLSLSSNVALQRVRRCFAMSKAGHAGTLDPLATGMLPIALGQATKYLRFLLAADKSYEFTIKLGQATTTADAEGEVIATAAIPKHSLEQIQAVFAGFVGAGEQIPPMYAAIKHQGKPLYALARAGKTVERAPRPIVINELQAIAIDGDKLSARVVCSKGTYVRVLAEDIAQALGSLGHLSALRRLSVAGFAGCAMHSLDSLQAMAEPSQRENCLLSVDAPLQHLPSVLLSAEQIKTLRYGQKVKLLSQQPVEYIRLYSSQQCFIGIGSIAADAVLSVVRLLA